MRHILRRATLAAALLCGALLPAGPAAAQPEPPPEFLIERLVVEGLEREAARQIVVAESRLDAGRTYSEQELREAVYRVKRLPFVVDAGMALRRGSERGAYELVITVEAAKPVAFSVDVIAFGTDPGDDDDADRFDFTGAGTLGVRKFVGARGLLFGSVQGIESFDAGQQLQVGYTRYGLFGRAGGYGTVALASRVGGERDDQDLQTSVQAGIPIVGNHALRGGLAWTRRESTLRFLAEGPIEQREDTVQGELDWIYDRTDDPLVTAEGLRFRVGGQYSEGRVRTVEAPADSDPRFVFDFDDQHLFLRADGRNYWRLTPRQSFAVGGYLWHTERRFRGGDLDNENLTGLELVHAASLWDHARTQHIGDLRLETLVGLSQFHEAGRDGDDEQDETDAYLQSSLLFRNAWGLIRLSLVYVDQIGGDR